MAVPLTKRRRWSPGTVCVMYFSTLKGFLLVSLRFSLYTSSLIIKSFLISLLPLVFICLLGNFQFCSYHLFPACSVSWQLLSDTGFLSLVRFSLHPFVCLCTSLSTCTLSVSLTGSDSAMMVSCLYILTHSLDTRSVYSVVCRCRDLSCQKCKHGPFCPPTTEQ